MTAKERTDIKELKEWLELRINHYKKFDLDSAVFKRREVEHILEQFNKLFP